MSKTALEPPHVALFPTAGMGHLTPFLRLSAMLASRGCHVTLITVKPTVSLTESAHMDAFFKSHTRIHRLEFEIPAFKPSDSTTDDPFFLQFEAISKSGHILAPLLSSASPPIRAIFSDFAVGVCITPIAETLNIPSYFVLTSSARFFSLMANLHSLDFSKSDENVIIPGLSPLPRSCIPPPFFNPNHLFTKLLTSNARLLSKTKGLLLNTFESFEPETITALRNGSIVKDLPPIFPIGPFQNYKSEKGNHPSWLNNQKVGSTVYISFGSRTALSKGQIRELGDGLEKSGSPFLWVLKTSKVDKDEEDGELRDLLGDSFLEKTKDKGLVVKGWAEQEEILAHPSIRGFMSHCGWNSVTESAKYGVPILAWPLHGDQRVNAEVVERSGLGIWERNWGWGGEKLIKGEEIGEKIKEMMSDEKLKVQAKKIMEEANMAFEGNGSSEKGLMDVVGMVKKIA